MPKQTARPKRPAAARLKSGFCMSRWTVRHRAQPLRTAHREKALWTRKIARRHGAFLRYPHYTKASQRCIAKFSKKPAPVVQIHNRHDKLLKAFLFEGFFTSFVANW